MANGRNPGRRRDAGRDPGGFVALPWSVLDCPAYAALSSDARALLMEFARQFVSDNNGRLLASRSYLGPRGWKSARILDRAKKELLAAGFIVEMVKGARPNKASWYAVTWRSLDKNDGYDRGAAALFERGAYRKNVPLIPTVGTGACSIAPTVGLESPPTAPTVGPMKPIFAASPVPTVGHHLDMPSPARTGTEGDQ